MAKNKPSDVMVDASKTAITQAMIQSVMDRVTRCSKDQRDSVAISVWIPGRTHPIPTFERIDELTWRVYSEDAGGNVTRFDGDLRACVEFVVT